MRRSLLLFTVLLFSILYPIGCGINPTESSGEDLWSRFQVEPLEEQMFNLINSDRASYSLPALIHDTDLQEVAAAHSEDMYIREFFNHENPDGDSVTQRCNDAGIEWSILGENIAFVNLNGNDSVDPVVMAEDSLMGSPSHRDNILSPLFTHVGVGIATDGEKYYFTQVFMVPRSRDYFSTLESPYWETPWTISEESFYEVWQRLQR